MRLAWFALISIIGWDGSAAAQHGDAELLPAISVLHVSSDVENGENVAEAVYRLLRQELRTLNIVRIAETPPLVLEDIQLAVGCIGESQECLTAVATQLEVDALLISHLTRVGDEWVLSVTEFRVGRGEQREVSRRTGGEHPQEDLLGEIEPLLRELYGLPPSESPELDLREPTPLERSFVAPAVIGSGGVAFLATALALGIHSQSLEDDYALAATDSIEEVDAALAIFDRAERQALAAKVLYGIGGTLAMISIVLFVREARRGTRSELGMTFESGPAGLRLRFEGTF